MFQPYIRKNGSEPRYSVFGDEDEALSKLRAGFNPDVLYPCSYKVRLWNEAGLLAPIDTSLLSNWPNVLEPLKNVPDSVIDGQRLFVPGDWGQVSVLFNAELAPEYVDKPSWGILWDEKYKGRLGAYETVPSHIGAAALYLGLNASTMDTADVEKVRKALKQQLPLLRLLSSDGTTLSQALVSGEVVATMAWNNDLKRVNDAVSTGEAKGKLVWMRPREGVLTWVCGLSIHAAAQENGMYEKCHELIDSWISAESSYYEMTQWYYGVTNRKAYEKVDDEFLHSIGLTRDVAAYLNDGRFMTAMKNEQEIVTMYEEVKAGL